MSSWAQQVFRDLVASSRRPIPLTPGEIDNLSALEESSGKALSSVLRVISGRVSPNYLSSVRASIDLMTLSVPEKTADRLAALDGKQLLLLAQQLGGQDSNLEELLQVERETKGQLSVLLESTDDIEEDLVDLGLSEEA